MNRQLKVSVFFSLFIFISCVVSAEEKKDTPEKADIKTEKKIEEKAAKKVKAVFREDFSATSKKGKKLLPAKWASKGHQWGVNDTEFTVVKDEKTGKNILRMKADKATGTYMRELSGLVDLKKYPIMRWRWKVTEFPKGGDGRKAETDDQPVGLYMGAGSFIRKSVSYRWETETPRGTEDKAQYAGGMVKVKWFCIRNKKDGADKWITEERNVVEDFKKAYGYIPEKFVISLVSNSQHTDSKAEAYVAWIEFLPASAEKKTEKSKDIAMVKKKSEG